MTREAKGKRQMCVRGGGRRRMPRPNLNAPTMMSVVDQTALTASANPPLPHVCWFVVSRWPPAAMHALAAPSRPVFGAASSTMQLSRPSTPGFVPTTSPPQGVSVQAAGCHALSGCTNTLTIATHTRACVRTPTLTSCILVMDPGRWAHWVRHGPGPHAQQANLKQGGDDHGHWHACTPPA